MDSLLFIVCGNGIVNPVNIVWKREFFFILIEILCASSHHGDELIIILFLKVYQFYTKHFLD